MEKMILFGFKGSGKTHLGRLLALELGCLFIDTDELLGAPVQELYQRLGEEAFRELEKEAILSIRQGVKIVVALGGGAILHPISRAHLSAIAPLIYLDASFETIRKRIVTTPLFVPAGETLAKVYERRCAFYRSIPARRVIVDGRTEKDIVREIMHG